MLCFFRIFSSARYPLRRVLLGSRARAGELPVISGAACAVAFRSFVRALPR
jgi:hypothetical protein